MIVSVEPLYLGVLFERGVYIFAPFYRQLDVVEVLVAEAGVVDVDALYVRAILGCKQILHGSFQVGALHPLLHAVHEYSVELLYIVLQK